MESNTLELKSIKMIDEAVRENNNNIKEKLQMRGLQEVLEYATKKQKSSI